MKIKYFSILTLSVLFLSCKKSTDRPAEENTPLRLVKKIVRYEEDGQVKSYYNSYFYDDAGHVIGITLNSDQPSQAYFYKGDTLTSMVLYNGTEKNDTLTNNVTIADNGNTILIDFTRPANGSVTDTIKITYKWVGDKLTEAWTYLNFVSNMPHLQKTIISYDANGKETTNTLVSQDETSTLQATVLEYDNKKNYFASISRLNYILSGWGSVYAKRSANNPVKIKYASDDSPTEYIWIYNEDGYPLSVQVKGKDYKEVELVYNQ